MDAVEGIPFALYDSFAARRFGGNVAGVVVVHPLPADLVMQSIAAEIGAPTTGFVDATQMDPPTLRLFTPRCEIYACGHVSLAVAVYLVEEGHWRVTDDRWTRASLGTAAGPLDVRLFKAGSCIRVSLRYTPTLVGSAERARGLIEETLGVHTDSSLAIEVLDTGLRHLVVGYPSVQALTVLRVADEPVRILAQSTAVDTICAFTSLGSGRFRMRDLTAAIGATEEPASGTTSSALAEYARVHNLLGERRNVSIEQGVEMGRPSLVSVEWEPSSADAGAWVTGTAVRSATGSLRCRTPK
jgi:trans-2,3-dihydro-3-hydroxyanthranilate isomerase